MGVKQVFRGPAERWVDTVRQTITGFDATQHFFANHSAEVDGDRAVDTRYMQARHQLGAEHYTIGGYYTGHMVRTPQGWRIASYKLTVTFSDGDRRLIASIPAALAATKRVCASVNVATTRAGINMDAVLAMAKTIRACAELTSEQDSIACAKLVVFANMVEDNPFMAGAVHGIGEPDAVINVGISGPGVVRAIVAALPQDADLTSIAEAIKATSFKITRAGELVAREAAKRLGVTMGIVDLSLAPTPAEGDSVAEIIEAMGVERCGGPGTTAALALLNDAVKKGGAMGTSSIGGLSGAFIPVSEDQGMIRAAESGALSIEKLEAMTSVCSVGLDMIAIPGDTTPETIAGIIADECAIGVVNAKTTAVRLIPAIGKGVGERLSFGGLLGEAPVMAVNQWAGTVFARRGGRFPAPLQSLKN